MWQLVTLALFAASIFAGSAAQLKLDMSDKSEAELLALMDDMTKLLNVQKAKLPGPIDQEVRFFCSNRQGAAFSQVMLNDQGLLAKMSMQKPVAFVIHGWTSSSQEAHFRDLAGNYSRYVDSNVCLVDWANLAAYSYDVASGQSIRMTANYLTRFVRFLNLNGIGYAKVTLIGHSLGAHISGFVGKNLGGEVGQIFALDPAGVMFTMPEDVGESNRLTKSDAKFVQVIYTTQGTLAMGISAGHQNLWMNNNGMYPQPGCKKVGEGKGLFSKTVGKRFDFVSVELPIIASLIISSRTDLQPHDVRGNVSGSTGPQGGIYHEALLKLLAIQHRNVCPRHQGQTGNMVKEVGVLNLLLFLYNFL